MAYEFNPNGTGELTEEELDFAMGGTGMSYEKAANYAREHGLANASHGGVNGSNDELNEEVLDHYLGGVPYGHTAGRGRR